MSNAMLEMVQTTVNEKAAEHNALVDKVARATKDGVSLAHDILADDSQTAPELVKWREFDEKIAAQRENARQQIVEWVKANLLTDSTLSDEEVAAAKETIKTLRDEVKSGLTFGKAVPGYTEGALTEPDLKSLRGGNAGGSGTGGKRPRLTYIKVNGTVAEVKRTNPKTKEEQTVSNFSTAAAAIAKDSGAKVEVKDLQAAAFEAAGTDDLSTVGGQVLSFSFSSNDKNYDIEFQPKNPEA